MSWLLLVSQLPALATQSVTLKWNPSANKNVAGYRIYYGKVSHAYATTISVGNVTNAVISGLSDGTAYFFAATTTDSGGNESDFSNEASFTTTAPVTVPVTAVTGNHPPTLNDLTNLTVYQNIGLKVITLSGITSGSASEKQVLKVTVATSNPNLIAKPGVYYTSPQSVGALILKPSTTLTGTSVITVTVNDGGKSNNVVVKNFTVTVIAPPNPAAPKFSKTLTNSFANVGQTITLSVAVTGKAPFKYQWKFNGTNLPGTANPTLTLQNIKTSQAGAYSVAVSNAAGSINSGAVLLSVYDKTAAGLVSLTQTNNPLETAATLTALTQTNGQFAFALAGVPGYAYVVQASSDLKNWVAVQTNASPFTFTDTNASSFNQRFYRTYYLSQKNN